MVDRISDRAGVKSFQSSDVTPKLKMLGGQTLAKRNQEQDLVGFSLRKG